MTDALAELLIREGNVLPETTLLVVIAGLVVLAAVDVWRHEVEDYAVVALLGIAVIGMRLEGIHPQQWLGAVLAAAVAFMVYLNLGQRGVLGGGDVKLSVVPAFVLGAVNPVIGVWWIACAILIHQVLFFITARVRKTREAIPHVPAMAAATMVAAVAFPGII
jgi:prepilin signal peptidase PulO-like enzyme (type II secretory pathway)